MAASMPPPLEPQPRFRAELEITETVIDGQKRFVLWDPVTELEIRLGPLEYYIATLCDGVRTAEQVVDIICEQGLAKRNVEKIVKLRDRLLNFRILEIPGKRTKDPSLSPFTGLELGPMQRLLVVKLLEITGDKWLVRLLERAPWLGTLACFNVCLGLVAASAALLFANWETFWYDLSHLDYASWRFWVPLFVLGNLVTAVHECGHAIACRAQGVRVVSIGWVLHFFLISAWTRPGRDWRRLAAGGRWITLLAGPVVSFVFTGLGIFAWRLTPPDTPAHFYALVFAITSFVGSAITLVPVHSGDGYVLLTDMLHIPDLRQRSMAYLKYLLTGKSKPKMQQGSPVFLVAFALGVTVWRLVLIYWVLRCAAYVPVHIPLWGWLMLAALAVITFYRPIGRGLHAVAGALKEDWRSIRKRRPSRRVWLAAAVVVVCGVPLPFTLTAPVDVAHGRLAHVLVPDGAAQYLAAGAQMSLRLDGHTDTRAAQVRGVHLEDDEGRFGADLDVSGAPLTVPTHGVAKIQLGWAPVIWRVARAQVSDVLPRLWLWI